MVFEATHKDPHAAMGAMIEEGLNHPNQYFTESMKCALPPSYPTSPSCCLIGPYGPTPQRSFWHFGLGGLQPAVDPTWDK